jgi:copper transport protein
VSRTRRPLGRAVRRLALAAVLVTVGSVLLAGPASAHASLLKTDPTEGSILAKAPATATFTFNEQVGSEQGGVHVFSAAGKELEADSHVEDAKLIVDLPSGMDKGTFIVAWRVISADGHPIAGSLSFSVGEPSTTVSSKAAVAESSPKFVIAVLGVSQAFTYLGVFGCCGLIVFLLLMLPRERGLDQLRARLLDLAGWFAWVTLIANFVLLPFNSLVQHGTGLGDLWKSQTWSDASGSQAVSALLLIGGTSIAVSLMTRGDRVKTPMTLSVVGVTLLSLSLVGHTRSVYPLWLMVAADVSHVAAGSIWFGGLIGLVIGLRRLTERPRIAAEMLGRFSGYAGFLLAAVAITGSILGWRILENWYNLFHTDFGIVLLVKVGFVGVVALVAAYNRFRLMPVVLADAGFADRRTTTTALQKTVRVEALLLVVVLGLTGFLVDRSPVQSTSAAQLPGGYDSSTFTGQTGNVKVVAVLKPAQTGDNTITLQLQDSEGDPIEPAALPTLSLAEGTLGLGDQALTNVDSGTYTASVLIPKPGTWTLSVSVPTSEFDNPVVSIKVPVTQSR